MFFLRKNIYLIPPIMLLASLLSSFIEYNYYIASNVLGYSILSSLVFLCVFRKSCWFTKLSVYGLIVMNLLGIFGEFIGYYSYALAYELFIVTIVIFLGIVLTINKV